MAKKTLLDLTQNILFAMDSDPVNSISDTIESMQVAHIIQDTFYEILNDRLWPRNKELFSLYPSTDSKKPTIMKIPPSISEILWIKYNKHEVENTGETNHHTVDLIYMEPKPFLDMVYQRSYKTNVTTDTLPGTTIVGQDGTVETSPERTITQRENISFDVNGRQVWAKTNKMPDYWTSLDDEYVLFDSFDDTEEDTITASRVTAYGYSEPVFEMSDKYVPELPTKAFPYLLSEAKSVAFNQIKQAANQKEEQRSSRQRRWLAREKFITDGGIKFRNNFGRNTPKGGFNNR